jgi:hypothetical protein
MAFATVCVHRVAEAVNALSLATELSQLLQVEHMGFTSDHFG